MKDSGFCHFFGYFLVDTATPIHGAYCKIVTPNFREDIKTYKARRNISINSDCIGNQLGIVGGLEAITERYVDVRLELKRMVLETYHKAVQKKVTKEKEQ